MKRRISGDGRVTVSLRKSMTRMLPPRWRGTGPLVRECTRGASVLARAAQKPSHDLVRTRFQVVDTMLIQTEVIENLPGQDYDPADGGEPSRMSARGLVAALRSRGRGGPVGHGRGSTVW